MKKYSEVYLVEGEMNFGFRYNYEDGLLEYVSRWDFRRVGDEWKDVILDDWEVTSAIGLSRENWEDNPQYWIDTYKEELDEECAHLAQYI